MRRHSQNVPGMYDNYSLCCTSVSSFQETNSESKHVKQVSTEYVTSSHF